MKMSEKSTTHLPYTTGAVYFPTTWPNRRVACSVVTSGLDHCNAMLYGVPAATFYILHWVQHNLATIVCQRSGRTDAREHLRSLCWLSVEYWVILKMMSLTFKVLSSSTPAHLSDLIQAAFSLWLSSAPVLSVSRTRTEHFQSSHNSACQKLTTLWRYVSSYCTTSRIPLVQTALTWSYHQCLCILGLWDAIQILSCLVLLHNCQTSWFSITCMELWLQLPGAHGTLDVVVLRPCQPMVLYYC